MRIRRIDSTVLVAIISLLSSALVALIHTILAPLVQRYLKVAPTVIRCPDCNKQFEEKLRERGVS